MGRICAPISLFVPAYLILVMSGWKGLRGVLPAAALCGAAFAGTQFLVSNFVGPQLTDILASIAAMGALLLVIRRRGGAPSKHSGREIALAWALKRSPVMLPIPGTSKVSHLEENVAAANVALSDDEFAALDREGNAQSGG